MLSLTYVNILIPGKVIQHMSIDFAILGILSYKPMSGYDLKKIIQNSSFMYWSGNNNQIYRALSDLLDQGLVMSEVIHQEGSPSKKIYEITDEGVEVLKQWVQSPIKPVEIKKPFLIHLAWSRQLNTRQLKSLIEEYKSQIQTQILLENSKREDEFVPPDRTALETTIWRLIKDNIVRTYENELAWIEELSEAISEIPNENDASESTSESVNVNRENRYTEETGESTNSKPYRVIHAHSFSYVHFYDRSFKLERERQILDIITVAAENNTRFVLIDHKSLSGKFFDPAPDLLAKMLQKFTMYNIRVSILADNIESLEHNFIAAISESRQKGTVGLFEDKEDAEKWFLSLKQQEDFDES